SGLGATAHVPEKKITWEGWEDSSVPPERLGEYLRALRALFERYGYECDLYGHFGQGCVHTRIDFDLETADGIATFRRFIHVAADNGDFARTVLRCVGVGACRKKSGTMCPSYMATGEEMHSTRGRARLLFEMLNAERDDAVLKQGWAEPAVKKALDLCLSCKG